MTRPTWILGFVGNGQNSFKMIMLLKNECRKTINKYIFLQVFFLH